VSNIRGEGGGLCDVSPACDTEPLFVDVWHISKRNIIIFLEMFLEIRVAELEIIS
jgi:hypothetical protein